MPSHGRQLKSIYTRMLLVICVAVIPAFIGLCLYLYQQRTYLTEFSKKSAQSYIELAAHDEAWLFNNTRQTLDAIALTPLMQEQDWSKCNQYLGALLKSQSNYVNFGAIDLQGDVKCAGVRVTNQADQNLADRTYFKRIMNGASLAIGEYSIGRISGKPTITVARALYDHNKELTGVLYAALNLSTIAQARQNTPISDGASLIILDRSNVVLSAIPPGAAEPGKHVQEKPIMDLISASDQGSRIATRSDGAEWLINHTRTGTVEDSQALTVVYLYPTQALLTHANRSFWFSVGIIFLLAIVTLALGWAGTQVFVGRNIQYLTAAAKRLRQRKFDTRIGNMVNGLEFTEIAQQFDEMAAELQEREKQWERSLQRQQGQATILQLIAKSQPLDETLKVLARFAQQQIDEVQASIVLLTPDGQRVASCIAPTLSPAYTKALIGLTAGAKMGSFGKAMHDRTTVISHDINTDPSWIDFKDTWVDYQELALRHGLRSCWSQPILSAQDDVCGAFSLYSNTPRSPSTEDLQLVNMVAELASVAIESLRQSEALRYQSRHDPLTGLFNEAVLDERTNEAIERIKKTNGHFYTILLALSGFKEINHTLSHAMGNELLKQVGQRLHAMSNIPDIARLSGSEFALLVEDITPPDTIQRIVDNVLEEIRRPFLLDGIQVQISASVGVAQCPNDGTTLNELVRHVHSAMDQAKNEGSGYAFYDPAKDQHSPNGVMLMSHLRRALKENEFVLHYQPKISISDNKTNGFEALVRWQDPERGLLFPGEFISAVELSDIIHPLTLWVINAATAQCKAWHNLGHRVSVAANVSVRNLLDIKLPEKIQNILDRHGLPAKFLELEITESAIMSDMARTLNVLRQIHKLGVRIAIDDFGTGHSSLAYLQQLPVDNLKVDQSFVMSMNKQGETLSIVSSIIALAHNLKLTVTAEGVEDEATLNQLQGLSCDYAQGYYISRPMTPAQVEAWLRGTIEV